MKRRQFLKSLGAGAAALAGPTLTLGLLQSGRARAAQALAKPNIVLILSDDYGYGSLNCYGADPALVKTPNLDRLAREGRRFTDACTPSSVCSPTRYGVLTGRYCWRTSLKSGVLSAGSPLHIEPERLTIPSLLKRHGYRSAAIGKWHLGYQSGPKTDFTKPLRPGPLELGFDTHFGIAGNHGDATGVYIEDDHVWGLRSATLKPYGVNFYKGGKFMGLDAPQREDVKDMDVLTDRAVGFIEKQKPGAPFFLYFTPTAVHEPITPSPANQGKSKLGVYGDYIQDLDSSVGRVLEALERGGFAENTLFIFTSDNGGENKQTKEGVQVKAIEAGLKMNGDWRGGKHSPFEGGFRVPFLVRWPGKARAGSVCDDPIQLTDLLATLAAVVGEKLPPPSKGAEDSFNALPAILGENTEPWVRPFVIQHSADGIFTIRQGPYKWIEGKPAGALKPGVQKTRADWYKAQLYHLKADPQEKNDLLADSPNLAARLADLLERSRAQGYTRLTE